MFNFLKKSKQNGLSDAKRMKMIRELSGLAIRYSTERADNTDNVVGKGGSLILRDDTFFVYSDAGTVFSCLSSEFRRENRESWSWIDVVASIIVVGGVIAAYAYFWTWLD